MLNFFEFELVLRVLFFLFGITLFSGIGLVFKYRLQYELNSFRWVNNIGLGFLNVISLKLLSPISLSGLAVYLQNKNLGLFHFVNSYFLWNNLVVVLVFIGSLIVLDFTLYTQHLVTHKVVFLWRLHRVHHTDIGFDTTTGLRFHPLEILFSFGVKASVVFIFGISAGAVIVFEILLNLSSLFNHSNFSLPTAIEKPFRALFVTPDMHRIHHSIIQSETNSNYGFCLSIWDKIFKTYLNEAKYNPKTMKIGIEVYRKLKDQSIIKLLIQPFMSR